MRLAPFPPKLTEEGLRQEQVRATATHTRAAVLGGDWLARLAGKRARIVLSEGRGEKPRRRRVCVGALGLRNEQVFSKLKEPSACQRADGPQ